MMIIQRAAFLVSVLSCVSVISIELKGNSTGNLRGNSSENVGENWENNVGESVSDKCGEPVGNQNDRGGRYVENVGNQKFDRVGENEQNVIENNTVRVMKDYLNQLGYKVGNSAVINVAEDQLEHVGNNITTNLVEHAKLYYVKQNVGNIVENYTKHVGRNVGNNKTTNLVEHKELYNMEQNVGNKVENYMEHELEHVKKNVGENITTNPVEHMELYNVEQNVGNKVENYTKRVGRNVGNNITTNPVEHMELDNVKRNLGNKEENYMEHVGRNVGNNITTNPVKHIELYNVEQNVGNKVENYMKHVGKNVGNNITTNLVEHIMELYDVEQNVGNKVENYMDQVGKNVGNNITINLVKHVELYNLKGNVGKIVENYMEHELEHVGRNVSNIMTINPVKHVELDNVGNKVENYMEHKLEHVGRNVGNNITTNSMKHVKLYKVGQNVGNKDKNSMEHVGSGWLDHVGNNNKNMEHVGKDDRENTENKPTTSTKQVRLKQLDLAEENYKNFVKHVRVKRGPTHHVETKVLNPVKVEKISEGKNEGNSTDQKNLINKDGKVIENHGNSSTNQQQNTTSIEKDLRANSTDNVVAWNVSNLEDIFKGESMKSVPTDDKYNDISFIPSYLLYNRREIDSLLFKNCGRRNKNGVLFGCFTKCCEVNQVLAPNITCIRVSLNESNANNYSQFNPSIDSLYSENLVDKTVELADNLVVPQGIPCRKGERFTIKSFENTLGFFIDNYNGSLKVTEKKRGKHVFLNHKPILDYCIDNVVGDNDKYYRMAVVCLKTTKMYREENNLTNYGYVSYLDPSDPEDYVLNRLFFIINGIFFSVVLMVYLLLPQLRTLNGWCIICFSLCSAVASFAHSAVLRGGWGKTACHLFPYTVAFSFLASFYWLNVMCFDIWWVFCGFRKSQMQPSKRGMDSKKFLYYSIYSWGSATAIIILVIATESLPFISEQWLLPKPDFGKTKCWFESKPAMWTYFYGPMASILVANLFFFMTTINKILKISKETRVLTHDGNKRHDEKEKQRYMLYFKLFLVMGITWVSEVVSFHFGSRQSSFVWIVTDVCNTLQGIPIFFIFVWKKKTLRLLNDRFCPSIRLMDASQNSTKTRETTNVTNNNIHSTANKKNVTKMDSSFEMKNLSPNGKVNGER